jgi:hypothetical protein
VISENKNREILKIKSSMNHIKNPNRKHHQYTTLCRRKNIEIEDKVEELLH